MHTSLSPAIEAKGGGGGADGGGDGGFTKTFKYAWHEESAGGCPNSDAFNRNPMFKLESPCAQRIFVKLRTSESSGCAGAGGGGGSGDSKAPHIGIHLYQSGQRVRRQECNEMKKVAGNQEYRALITWAEYDVMQVAAFGVCVRARARPRSCVRARACVCTVRSLRGPSTTRCRWQLSFV